MKKWHEKTKKIARIIIVVFLLLLMGLGLYLVVHKFFPSSPLKNLSAQEVTFVAVLDEPAVLKKGLENLDALLVNAPDEAKIASFKSEEVLNLLTRVPKNTALVGYTTTLIAVFYETDQTCASFAQGQVLATEEQGMCILHTAPLSKAMFETKSGSITSHYGGILPDNVSGVKALFTEHFPLEEVVTQAMGGIVTPEVLLARAIASKHYPVMLHLTQRSSEDLQLEGYVVFGEKNVPQALQLTKVSPELVSRMPKDGAAFLFPIGESFYAAWNSWIALEFGEDVQRMFDHVLLATTESLTPVGVPSVPDASVLLEVPVQGSGILQAIVADVDTEERELMKKSIEDSLTFLYGLTSKAATLPDATRGILVRAENDAVAIESSTMSGEIMTLYTADEEPRLSTTEKGDLLYLTLPGTMSGSVLRTPTTELSRTQPSFPIPLDQLFMMKMPLPNMSDLYMGITFLPDRLKFDLVLTARS